MFGVQKWLIILAVLVTGIIVAESDLLFDDEDSDDDGGKSMIVCPAQTTLTTEKCGACFNGRNPLCVLYGKNAPRCNDSRLGFCRRVSRDCTIKCIRTSSNVQLNIPRDVPVSVLGLMKADWIKSLELIGDDDRASSLKVTEGALIGLNSLTTLSFQNITLEDVPPPGSLPTSLKNLKLVNCNLTMVPKDVSLMAGLLVLDISRNDIKDFPNYLKDLADLKSLNMTNNTLNSNVTISKDLFDFLNKVGSVKVDIPTPKNCPDGYSVQNVTRSDIQVCVKDGLLKKILPIDDKNTTKRDRGNTSLEPTTPTPNSSSATINFLPFISLGAAILLLT